MWTFSACDEDDEVSKTIALRQEMEIHNKLNM